MVVAYLLLEVPQDGLLAEMVHDEEVAFVQVWVQDASQNRFVIW